MDDNSVPPRRPNSDYHSKNGFDVAFTDGDIQDTMLAQALDRHRLALHTLETRGRPVPSFEEMQRFVEEIETSATLGRKIQALQKEHLEDLRELYSYHSRDYYNDANDFWKSYDETQFLEPGERSREIQLVYHQLERLHSQNQSSTYLNSPFVSEFEQLRHGYLKRLLELQKHLQEVTKREMDLKRRDLAKFPRNSGEFNLSPSETKARVAKFLVADAKDRERMKDEFVWSSLATQPLIDEFQKDGIFNAVVRAAYTESMKTTDPRRRPSFA